MPRTKPCATEALEKALQFGFPGYGRDFCLLMELSQLDFELPEELIAQTPAQQRDASCLLRVDRATRTISHHAFAELPDLLPQPCRIFRNNATVLKARLAGRRPQGGAVECLLLNPVDGQPFLWNCLLKPGRKLPVGATFTLPEDTRATVETKQPDGLCRVRFETHRRSMTDLAAAHGQMPLPHYISREQGDLRAETDESRYQTVYADPAKPVAAAAPTAGLHFTPGLLDTLATRGHRFHDLTLHVGIGTFRPIASEQVEAHQLHTEFYELPAETATAASTPGSPRLAIGTTSVRSLEDFRRRHPLPYPTDAAHPFTAEADIFLYPPATFHAVDHLITNFHLPRSSLLCLVGAFLAPDQPDGIEWLKEIYAEAIAHRYRFFSYGDAMLII